MTISTIRPFMNFEHRAGIQPVFTTKLFKILYFYFLSIWGNKPIYKISPCFFPVSLYGVRLVFPSFGSPQCTTFFNKTFSTFLSPFIDSFSSFYKKCFRLFDTVISKSTFRNVVECRSFIRKLTDKKLFSLSRIVFIGIFKYGKIKSCFSKFRPVFLKKSIIVKTFIERVFMVSNSAGNIDGTANINPAVGFIANHVNTGFISEHTFYYTSSYRWTQGEIN